MFIVIASTLNIFSNNSSIYSNNYYSLWKKLTSRDAHILFVLEFKNINFIHNLTVDFLTSLTLRTVDLNKTTV